VSLEFSRQEYWCGLPFPLQGILPTQESNPSPPHCSQILYCLSQLLSISGIAGSYGNSTFSFLRNLHSILPSGYTNFFILISPSSDWMKATHVSKDNLLYSVYCFKCVYCYCLVAKLCLTLLPPNGR